MRCHPFPILAVLLCACTISPVVERTVVERLVTPGPSAAPDVKTAVAEPSGSPTISPSPEPTPFVLNRKIVLPLHVVATYSVIMEEGGCVGRELLGTEYATAWLDLATAATHSSHAPGRITWGKAEHRDVALRQNCDWTPPPKHVPAGPGGFWFDLGDAGWSLGVNPSTISAEPPKDQNWRQGARPVASGWMFLRLGPDDGSHFAAVSIKDLGTKIEATYRYQVKPGNRALE